MSTTTMFVPAEAALPRRTNLSRWITYCSIVFADVCATSVAGALAVLIRFVFHGDFTPTDWIAFAPSLLLVHIVFALVGLYPGVATNPIDEFRLILSSSSIAFLLIIGATFFLRQGMLASRMVFVLAWLFEIVLVPLFRRSVRGVCGTKPWWGIPTVIMGERESAVMMLNMLEGHPRLALRPIALLLDTMQPSETILKISNNKVFLGDIADAGALSTVFSDCYAVIAMPSKGSDRLTQFVNDHAELYHHVLIIPDLFGMASLAVKAKDICGILTFEVEQQIVRKVPRLIKRTFDILVSTIIMIPLLPLFVVLCLLVGLTSKGPIFFGHKRIGRNERSFHVWKFRTMVMNAEVVLQKHLDNDPELKMEWERDQKLRKDPRVTLVGNYLRKYSLDELPQLWNVICGEMSLVGPRPIVPSEVEKYGHIFRHYRRVTPGITGLWQVSGRNNTTYDRRIEIDHYYVRNWSLALDLYILLRTMKTVCFSEGAY